MTTNSHYIEYYDTIGSPTKEHAIIVAKTLNETLANLIRFYIDKRGYSNNEVRSNMDRFVLDWVITGDIPTLPPIVHFDDYDRSG